jgi:hypothetical protein
MLSLFKTEVGNYTVAGSLNNPIVLYLLNVHPLTQPRVMMG